jgi:hypothetical protein
VLPPWAPNEQLEVNVTFILNVLHKNMSLVAADKRAIAKESMGGVTVHDYKKVVLNQSKNLVLGIAGHTHEHPYTQAIERSADYDEALLTIHNHLKSFPRIHDRATLITLTSFMVNQGIASFFDRDVGEHFSFTFLFSPVESSSRMYRGPADGARLLHVGSGSKHFEQAVNRSEVDSFVASISPSCTPAVCIPWIRGVFKKISTLDPGTGDEAVFVVSTRSSPRFQFIESF